MKIDKRWKHLRRRKKIQWKKSNKEVLEITIHTDGFKIENKLESAFDEVLLEYCEIYRSMIALDHFSIFQAETWAVHEALRLFKAHKLYIVVQISRVHKNKIRAWA